MRSQTWAGRQPQVFGNEDYEISIHKVATDRMRRMVIPNPKGMIRIQPQLLDEMRVLPYIKYMVCDNKIKYCTVNTINANDLVYSYHTL